MIARYMLRRAIGALMVLGRTLRGRERHSTPKMGTGLPGSVLGPHRGTQEVEG